MQLSFAQGGTIRGNIYDKDSGEPIIYCNVIISDTNIGATTDVNGFFTINDLDPGDYILMATYLGYDTIRTEIRLRAGEILYRSLFLSESGIQLQTVDISAKREQSRTEVQISKVSVSPREIKALPSVGGEADIAQYLQVLPGIISTGDQGGQIYIRGGSPIQNKILLDGLTIFNPFHSLGFFSVFETEIIRNVDVLTGGFNAEYGGRISAVVDINTREGNRKRFGGVVSANPFVVKALVEGPIIKLKDEGGGSTSFVFSSKKSIIEETSPHLYDYASLNDSIGLPFDFHDSYGKISFISGNGSKLNLFGFNFSDGYNNTDVANIKWDNKGGGANFNLVPGNSNMILGGLIGYTDYNVSLREADENPRSSRLKNFTVALDFSFFGRTNEFKYGFEVNGMRTDFEFTNPFNVTLNQFQNTTEFAAFFSYRQIINKLVIEPSIRVQYYASLGDFSFEPRFGFKYNASEHLRIKGAGGLYSQNLISASNERDVVNLFSGFLSGPESQVFDLDGELLSNKLQHSRHAILGVEYDINRNLEINLEGYLKEFPQLITVNRNKLQATDPNFAVETGEAYGVDFSVKYETSRAYLWGTYSLGFVDRYDGIQEFPTVFDRRHNVNALASYKFGPAADWQLSVRWNMGSGFPFTKTQAFYNFNPFLNGVSTDFLTENPEDVGIIFSEDRNSGKLPYYHRLDISLQKSFNFTKYSTLDVIASVTNAYDRENIFYFDRVRFERVNQLPILPSLGIKLKI
jgi:hypothetical protein